MKIPAILAAAALALSACTGNTFQPGQILDYTRTNTDGSEWERVSIYRKSEAEVEVYKMRSRCTNAALVTAKFDPSTDEAVSLTGGRLTRDGKQEAFAYLKLEQNDRNLEIRFDGGWLWLDTYDGTVVEAVAPRPNHPGYKDFRLVRTGESKGARAWSERLADHWTGCQALPK